MLKVWLRRWDYINPMIFYTGLGFGGFFVWIWVRKGKVGLKVADWTKKLEVVKKSHSVFAAGLSGVVLNCPVDSDLWREVIESLAPWSMRR